ncbi:MAG: hypothetical protein J1F41_01705 [Lachnospiraceae bacterium]|nr:hypothetical protein [Lachnospiraceae bacterium]
MKCKRVGLIADVVKYEEGMGLEDGFELMTDVITKGWIVADSLIQIKRDNGTIVCPYIVHRRGHTFINEGDYIITDADGTKHVCGEDKIFQRYQPVEE